MKTSYSLQYSFSAYTIKKATCTACRNLEGGSHVESNERPMKTPILGLRTLQPEATCFLWLCILAFEWSESAREWIHLAASRVLLLLFTDHINLPIDSTFLTLVY